MQQLLRAAMRACAALVLAGIVVVPAGAQSAPGPAQAAPSAAQSAAEKAYQAKDYTAAAVAFRAIIAAEPANAMAWYRLGVSLQMLGRLDEARRDLAMALDRGFHPFSVHYRLAQIALKGGDKAGAVAELEKGVATQPVPPETLSDDPDLAPLRGMPAFVALVDKEARATHPCRFDAGYHALDFWIGDWVVKTIGGSEMGRSHIAPALDGCAIEETWTGALGGDGKSLSSYDAVRKHWVQHYVTSNGTYNDYDGAIDGKSIVMIAPIGGTAKPGKLRMSYTPLADGRVRQLMETSFDGGATWTAGFDGYYEKAAPKP